MCSHHRANSTRQWIVDAPGQVPTVELGNRRRYLEGNRSTKPSLLDSHAGLAACRGTCLLEENADYVKKLTQKGAVVIGKIKMAQFASSDEPTDQWIDFHYPVNPRGDQYQSPSGSSSEAAAALAGYPWLDFSIAGD